MQLDVLTDRCVTVDAELVEGRPLVRPETLQEALGWSLEDRGLCRGDECLIEPAADVTNNPVRTTGTDGAPMVDLTAVTDLVGAPSVLWTATEPAALVVGTRSSALRGVTTGDAFPDATLTDLDENRVPLSNWKGTRRVLLAWSTW